MIPESTIKKLPPGKMIGREIVKTMDGKYREAIKWAFVQFGCVVRHAYFDKWTGEYIGDDLV